MVGLGRVELPTHGLGNRCSIHLSYRPATIAKILTGFSFSAQTEDCRSVLPTRNSCELSRGRPMHVRLVQRSAASPERSQISSCGIVLPTITPSRHDIRASCLAHSRGEAVCEVKRARWDPRHDPAAAG